MREFRRLGSPRRARGGREVADVVGLALRHVRLEKLGLALAQLSTRGEQRVPAHEPVVREVVAHPPRVLEHNLFDVRQFFPPVQNLVHLLLVLGQHDAHVGVGEQVGDLVADARAVHPHAHRPDALRREFHHGPGGDVVGHDGHLVARRHAQREEAQRGVLHLQSHLRPGGLVPDAEILVAQSHPHRCGGGAL